MNDISIKNRKGYSIAALLLASTAFTQAALIAHFKFDETTGTTAINAVAGAANGTINGGATINQNGISGRAYLLDGVDDYVEVGISGTSGIGEKITASKQLTLSFWVSTTGTNGLLDTNRDVVVSMGKSTTSTNYVDSGLISTGGVITSYGRVRENALIAEANGGTTAANTGTWTHIAMTINDALDANLMTLYLNGVATNSTAPSLTITSPMDILRVGALARSAVADFYTGLVDDVQIYDQALSQSQISFLGANAGQAVPEPGGAAMLSLFGSLLLLRKRR